MHKPTCPESTITVMISSAHGATVHEYRQVASSITACTGDCPAQWISGGGGLVAVCSDYRADPRKQQI